MKRLLKMLAISVTALSLVACGSTKEDSKETLVIYSPNSDSKIEAVIPLFEEKYGITVELQQAGTGELMKRVQNESSDPIADVLWGAQHSQIVQNKDYFEDYLAENDKNILADFQNKHGVATSYALEGSVLLVNTDLIGDIKIESYEDLLNPELKGRIATGDPASSSSAFAQLTNMLLAKGGYESEEAWQFVEDLFTNIDGKVYASSSAVHKSVADGEMVVALTYEDPSLTLVNDGAPVKVVYPSEGTVFLPSSGGIIKNAKNMDNAKKFIDFICSEELQAYLSKNTTNRPVLEDVVEGDNKTKMKDIYVIHEDQDYTTSNKDEIVKRFKELYSKLAS